MTTILTSMSRATWLRALLPILTAFLVLTVSGTSLAAGRIVWKQTTLKERTDNESWRLELEIHLGRPPDIAHKSVKFEFTQTEEFERSLVDGQEAPQTRTVPLTNQQALIESQTVGFMDPGSGQVQSRTRFSFKVTRAHGYRAGTYRVVLKDADTGATIGVPTNLRFEGENPVVDRRSIVFQPSDNKKKDKKKEEAAAAPESSDDSSSMEDTSSDEPLDESSDVPQDEGQVPPSIEEKPGGGCHHTPEDSSTGWPLLAAGAALLVFVFRRRRAD